MKEICMDFVRRQRAGFGQGQTIWDGEQEERISTDR